MLKRKLPYLGHIGDKMKKRCFKKSPKMPNRKGLFFHRLQNKKTCHVLLCQRHYSDTPKIRCYFINYFGKPDCNHMLT